MRKLPDRVTARDIKWASRVNNTASMSVHGTNLRGDAIHGNWNDPQSTIEVIGNQAIAATEQGKVLTIQVTDAALKKIAILRNKS